MKSLTVVKLRLAYTVNGFYISSLRYCYDPHRLCQTINLSIFVSLQLAKKRLFFWHCQFKTITSEIKNASFFNCFLFCFIIDRKALMSPQKGRVYFSFSANEGSENAYLDHV